MRGFKSGAGGRGNSGRYPHLDDKPVKPKNQNEESRSQKALIKQLGFIRFRGRPLTDFIYAIPNGGLRTKKTGGVLKAEGVKRGVPDMHLIVPMGEFHSLYIEMKTETGELTPEQTSVIQLLRECGHKVVVCRGEGHAMSEIVKYLEIGS